MTNNQTVTPELLDQLLANYEKPEDLMETATSSVIFSHRADRIRERRPSSSWALSPMLDYAASARLIVLIYGKAAIAWTKTW